MTGVTLHGLDVTAVQLQPVGDTPFNDISASISCSQAIAAC